MLTRLLRADLRRTRTTSTVLAGLVALAALMAALGGTMLAQLTGSLDRLFADARTPDIVQMHTGPIDVAAIEAWAANRPEVADVQVSTTLPVPVDELFLAGRSEAGSVLQPAVTTQNPRFDLLLGLDNEVLQVQPGTIVLPVHYAQQRGVRVGDPVSLRFPDATIDLRVAGFLRDSTMNPGFVTSKRLLVHASDLAAVAPHVAQPEYLIGFRLHQPDAARAVSDAYGDSGLATHGMRLERSLFHLANAVSHGVGIGVLLLMAVLLVAVALIALRFSFLTAVERDLREIGVMKAIGLPARDIRRMYLVKYTALAVAGGVLGLLASLPASDALTAGLRLQLGDSHNPLLQALVPPAAVAGVVGVVLGLCALMLRRLDRVTAMDALRAAATGHPGRARGPRLRLARSRVLHPSAWLGLNDVLRGVRAHGMLFAVLVLCTFGMVVPLNVWTTASSPTFVTYMGTGVADLRLELRTPEAVAQAPTLTDALAHDPEVTRYAHLVSARFDVRNPEGKWEALIVENGDHDTFPLSYLTGVAPRSPDEVSLSTLAADSLGVRVGDTLTLRGRTGERSPTVVGTYQDVTNGGRTAKGLLPTEGEPIVWHTIPVDVAAGTTPDAVGARLAAAHPGVQAIGMAEFARQVLGELLDLTRTLTAAAAAVALALAFGIATMFAQLALARDTSQVAVQRALGIPDAALRLQYVTRFLTVLVAGVVVGTLAVATVGEALMSVALGRTLGAPALRFTVDPLLAYGAFPAALALAVVAATLLATRTFRATTVTHLAEE